MLQTKIFGCKTNKYYAEKWLSSGELDGLSGVFVVSCVVTDQAKSRWIKFVHKATEWLIDENDRIYLSGCGTIDGGRLDPEFWFKYPELKEHQEKVILLGQEPHKVDGPRKSLATQPNLREKLAKLSSKQALYTRKHIVIQTGCDTFCTFCATIHARWRHKNRPEDEIIKEIQNYENSWGKEIVITGINLGAWWSDSTIKIGDSRFPELLESILERTTIPRIRISSTGVEFVSDKLIKLYSESRINPHIHLSVQSASDAVLKRMNRKYDRDTLLSCLEKIQNVERKDGIPLSIGADMIVGFPGETASDHQDSVDLVRDYGITKLHAFPFSSHVSAHSVPAARLKEQVDQNTKYTRLREIIQIGDTVRSDFVEKNLWQGLRLLIEKVSDGSFSGWSENYIALDQDNFWIIGGKVEKNTIVTGVLTGWEKKDEIEKKPSII